MERRVRLASAVFFALLLAISCLPSRGGELGDVVYSRATGTQEFPPAYFPHWVHRIKYKCYACHDGLFPMRHTANPTMDSMSKGESCGVCHNGKLAFGVDMCQRCHVRQ